MSLLQLSTTGTQNSHIRENVSHELIELPIEWNQPQSSATRRCIRTIPLNADSCTPKYIVLQSNQLHTIAEFKNAMAEGSFEIQIGGSQISKLDFSILMKLTEVKKLGNSYTIFIPGGYTMGEINLCGLVHHGVSAIFEIPNANLIENVRFFADYKFYDNNRRQELVQPHEKIVQNISMSAIHTWQSSENSNISISLNTNHIIKGHFIEGDLSKIERLNLKFNGQDRLIYDEVMLDLQCHKISNNLHYLSYTGDNNYQAMTFDSYTGAPNHSRIDSIRLNLRLKPSYLDNLEPMQSTLKFYSISFGILKYMAGMAGLEYGGNSSLVYTGLAVDPAPIQVPIQVPIQIPMSTNNDWPSQERELDPEKNECPITQLEIGTEYGLCTTCSNAFEYTQIRHWLHNHTNCPMCRTNWTNKIKYTRVVDNITQSNNVDQNASMLENLAAEILVAN